MALDFQQPLQSSVCFPVQERSQVGEARRQAALWAEERDCGPELLSKLALVISELGTNLSLHTQVGGLLVLRLIVRQDCQTLEILSLDSGPGRADFSACLKDGYSTSGTAGNGLGAVRRVADLFEVHSQLGIGTAILCVISVKPHLPTSRWQHGIVNVMVKGEVECGDAAAFLDLGGGRSRLMVADGLGHGELAADASSKARDIFLSQPEAELTDILHTAHTALRSTRGSAMAIAEVDAGRGFVTYAGVGNISGIITRSGGENTHLVSNNGTLGMVMTSVQKFQYPWEQDALLVMTSDGIKNHWRLERYQGLSHRHPSLVAGVLFRDHGRKTDDMTVAALRLTPHDDLP